MSDNDDTLQSVSALTVQRDSAHRELLKLRTENRVLKRHQADVRAWLADAIEQYEADPGTADQIKARATELLREAETLL